MLFSLKARFRPPNYVVKRFDVYFVQHQSDFLPTTGCCGGGGRKGQLVWHLCSWRGGGGGGARDAALVPRKPPTSGL